MNLKNPSMSSAVTLVGVGLIALSGAIIFVASGRPALAAPDEVRRGGPRGGPITADPAISMRDDGPPPLGAMGGVDWCDQGEPLDWFGEIRSLPVCWLEGYDSRLFFPMLRFECCSGNAGGGLFDLNGDGRPERIRERLDGRLGDHCILSFVGLNLQDGSVGRIERCLLEGSTVADFAASIGFDPQYTYISDCGWSDLDDDGDLDFAFVLQYSYEQPVALPFWIENIGFEATQPLVGDLDGDGAVGASDLTLLLGGWTGN